MFKVVIEKVQDSNKSKSYFSTKFILSDQVKSILKKMDHMYCYESMEYLFNYEDKDKLTSELTAMFGKNFDVQEVDNGRKYNADSNGQLMELDNTVIGSLREEHCTTPTKVDKVLQRVYQKVTKTPKKFDKNKYSKEKVGNIKKRKFEEVENDVKKSATIKSYDEIIDVKFDYDPELIEWIKGIDTDERKYIPADRIWRINEEYADMVCEKLISLGYTIIMQ